MRYLNDTRWRRRFAAGLAVVPAAVLAYALATMPVIASQTNWEARLAHAESDSITLALDLVDNALTLELGGVVLRRCPIVSADASRLVRYEARGDSTGEPVSFRVERSIATLPKVPIRVVEAPRDSAEARAQALEEVPVEATPAHFKLWFDRGLTVTVIASPATPAERVYAALFAARARVRSILYEAAGRGAERPIRVELAPADAKAVYRAIPPNARLALRY